jgi:hypothetical protein
LLMNFGSLTSVSFSIIVTLAIYTSAILTALKKKVYKTKLKRKKWNSRFYSFNFV